MGIRREIDYNYQLHISLNFPEILLTSTRIIQIVTERYMVIEDGIVYFTLKSNIRKQGEGR